MNVHTNFNDPTELSTLEFKGKFIDSVVSGNLTFRSPENRTNIKPGILVGYFKPTDTFPICAVVKDPWTGKEALFNWDTRKDRPVLVGVFSL